MLMATRLLLQCKELYLCVKESMDKAANRNSSRAAGTSHTHTAMSSNFTYLRTYTHRYSSDAVLKSVDRLDWQLLVKRRLLLLCFKCLPSVILYLLPPSTAIHGVLPVQFTCLTVFLHNLCSSPFWSTSWSGTLHFILRTFLHQLNLDLSRLIRTVVIDPMSGVGTFLCTGLKLESEFPVQDIKSGQGGLLQVCMEGIGLLFANTKVLSLHNDSLSLFHTLLHLPSVLC